MLTSVAKRTNLNNLRIRNLVFGLAILVILFVFGFSLSANAFSVNYNSSNLIDNPTLRNNAAMSENAIQSFLNNIGSGLASVQDNEACDSTIAPYYSHCGQTISAAQIIYDASQAYGINPEAILATLEKEQGLVTEPAPNSSDSAAVASYQAALNCAMGYNSCSGYVGFFTQVDNGAWTLIYNYQGASRVSSWLSWSPASHYPCANSSSLYSTGLYPGNNVTFYDPGGTAENITLANAASASLYCYTPYVGPYSQTGYSGSYNFVYYFQLWFGSTQASTAYAWTYEGQNQYINSGYSQPFTNGIYIAPGQTAYLSLDVRNVGYQTWQQGSVFLGTSRPNSRPSVFSNTTWSSNNEIPLPVSSVAPGGEANFIFSITAPSTPGTYQENFNMVANGNTWFNDGGAYFTINVVQPRAVNNSFDSSMTSGQTLYANQHLTSPDGYSTLNLLPNGNLVEYTNFEEVWSNNVYSPWAYLTMSANGNLVEYSSGNSQVWSSNTSGNSGSSLILQTDGNLVIYTSSNSPIWATMTNNSVPNNLDRVDFNMPVGTLWQGQSLYTANLGYRLTLQSDGNLVEYTSNNTPIWASGTQNIGVMFLAMQADGNMVLYNSSYQPVWGSNTVGAWSSSLVLQPDGTLLLNSPSGYLLWGNNRLYPGESLGTIYSSYRLTMQTDGNLVIYNNSSGQAVWASNTAGETPGYLVMQTDGNLVLYNSQGKPYWASGTNYSGPSNLVMQNDGNLVIYKAGGGAVWGTNTVGK